MLLWTHQAQSANFSGSATITYTITSIANLDNPGDHAALDISGLFELAPPPDYSVILSGDGTLNNQTPNLGPISVGNSFSHTFSINGHANDGSVDSSHLGLFSLILSNGANDSFNIGVKMDYLLNATVQGDYANSEVSMEYLDSGDNFSGSDFVAANFAGDNTSKTGSTGILNFALGPSGSASGSQELWTDVRIAGYVQASPVPLPASCYMLLSGLAGIFSFSKSRRLRG